MLTCCMRDGMRQHALAGARVAIQQHGFGVGLELLVHCLAAQWQDAVLADSLSDLGHGGIRNDGRSLHRGANEVGRAQVVLDIDLHEEGCAEGIVGVHQGKGSETLREGRNRAARQVQFRTSASSCAPRLH